MYNLTNTAKGAGHVVYDVARRPQSIPVGKTVQIQLSDPVAVALRRQQISGSTLHIAPADDRGEEILKRALEPLPARPFKLVPAIARDRLSRALDTERIPPPLDPPVKDELLEQELATASQTEDIQRSSELPEPAPVSAPATTARARRKSRRR